ncbi:MAG: hypothetical protein K8R60_14370 [Burkholderiales bacterium]|nr:hypothetical protein [Burkholderiales bacterium]
MSTAYPPADKATQQLLTKIATADKAIDEALLCFGSAKEKAEPEKEVKALRARIDAARRLSGAAAAKALTPLLKEAEALGPKIFKASTDLFAKRRREELFGQVNGALAGALLDIGKISDPALAKLMFAEQAAMRARMDKAEKMKKDIEAVSEMDDLDDEIPALQKRLKSALAVSAWLGSGFKSMLALAESSIASVPNARCRDVLRAELDFSAQAKNGALAKLDVKAIEAATQPALRRVQKVASRLSADGSALDRELMRVGKLVKDAGAPAELAARLKKLAQEKAGGWPQVREFENFEKALDAFEKSLAELAAAAQKAQATASH